MMEPTAMMDPTVKELWLKDLRGGMFQQGRGALKRVDQDSHGKMQEFHCCLGVLCERYRRESGDLMTWHPTGEFGTALFGDAEVHVLPQAVADWAGLAFTNPQVRVPKYDLTTLADLNDSGFSFHRIADFIEELL
jgi:hypothetical protein